MRYQITYDDPETLTRPLTISVAVTYEPDTEMLENVCNEDQRDTARLSAGANPRIPLSPAVIDKYVGTYEFRGGSPAVAAFMGKTQAVTVVNGQLYLNALPMIPLSETTFDSTGASAEFLLDGDRATQLVLKQTEGDARYDRKR